MIVEQSQYQQQPFSHFVPVYEVLLEGKEMNKLTIYSAGSFRYALLELTRAFKQYNDVEIECIGARWVVENEHNGRALADLY